MENFDSFKPKYTKVSTENETYISELMRLSELSENEVYGSGFLRVYEREKNPPKELEFMREHYRELTKESCKRVNKELQEIFISSKSKQSKYATEFLERGIFYSTDLQAYAVEFIGDPQFNIIDKIDSPEKRLLARMLSKLLSRRLGDEIKKGREMSPDMLASLVMANQSAMEEVEEELKNDFLPELKVEFELEILKLFESLGLSEDKVEKMVQRINSTAVHVVDGITASLEGMGGAYSDSRHSILIAAHYVSDYKREKLREIVFHEFLHALSGRLIYEDKSSEYFASGRSGLEFSLAHLQDNPSQSNERFKWLNEAVTEQLTVQMIENTGNVVREPTYQTEMKLLEYLCSKGNQPIDFQKFVHAYLEDYEPASEGKETIPAWRTLRTSINNAFDAKFLIKLDNRIAEVGSKAAFKELTTQDNSV